MKIDQMEEVFTTPVETIDDDAELYLDYAASAGDEDRLVATSTIRPRETEADLIAASIEPGAVWFRDLMQLYNDPAEVCEAGVCSTCAYASDFQWENLKSLQESNLAAFAVSWCPDLRF